MTKHLKSEIIDSVTRYYQEAFEKDQKDFEPGDRIPYAGRVFDAEELINLVDAATDFWLTAGRYASKFEKDLSQFLGIKHISLTNSGSSANLLAFMALTSPELGDQRIEIGDEVITVAAGFPTTVAPLIHYGAVPVFLDITLPTYNMDCTGLEQALSDRTKAVMVAHTLGNPFDLKTLMDFCERHNLWLIEDNCDALGSRYKYKEEWRYTGTIGHLGTSSFYPPHHITMGEGGAVYTDNDLLLRIVNSFRDWGRACWCSSGKDNTCGKRFQYQLGELPYGYDHKYTFSHFGYNLKLTDMQAAIGCAQLAKLPQFIAARHKNWQMLHEGMSDLEEWFILPEPTTNSQPCWFGFPIAVRENKKFSRNDIVGHLEDEKIQTRMLFAGNILRHPCFNEMRKSGKGFRKIGDLKTTDLVMMRTFWIGVYPGLSQKMVDFMIDTITKFVKKF
ncbi:MAG: lipopolysaccharide biosynthesis protein RfbH [Desulfobacterales bacterium]|jgi:CDP-6-deoxy-D-xylo-4-hexulose-3-dehydrase